MSRRIKRTANGFEIRTSMRSRRCIEFCPLCKQQCGGAEKHDGMAHQCSSHWWASFIITGNDRVTVSGTHYAKTEVKTVTPVRTSGHAIGTKIRYERTPKEFFHD